MDVSGNSDSGSLFAGTGIAALVELRLFSMLNQAATSKYTR